MTQPFFEPQVSFEILHKRAQALAQKTEEVQEHHLQVVLFSIGERNYALDTFWVREVSPTPSITPLPFVPSFILGLFSLRGEILTAADLELFLEITDATGEIRPLALILASSRHSLALLVDQVKCASALPAQALQSPLSTMPSSKRPYFKGELQISEEIYAYLDMAKILQSPKWILQ